jgi:hypothetical protein
VSDEFRTALASYCLVRQLFERVLSDVPVDREYVLQAEQKLEELGMPLPERALIWLAEARFSATLGKQSDESCFLERKLQGACWLLNVSIRCEVP